MTINSDSSIIPPFLSDHDHIELIAPARSVLKKDIDSAIKIIESKVNPACDINGHYVKVVSNSRTAFKTKNS